MDNIIKKNQQQEDQEKDQIKKQHQLGYQDYQYYQQHLH